MTGRGGCGGEGEIEGERQAHNLDALVDVQERLAFEGSAL